MGTRFIKYFTSLLLFLCIVCLSNAHFRKFQQGPQIVPVPYPVTQPIVVQVSQPYPVHVPVKIPVKVKVPVPYPVPIEKEVWPSGWSGWPGGGLGGGGVATSSSSSSSFSTFSEGGGDFDLGGDWLGGGFFKKR